MINQPLSEWLPIDEAAAFIKKSPSTLRRLLPEIESAAPDNIRREPMEGRGGEKVLISRAYLIERFNIKEEPEAAPKSNEDEERRGDPGAVPGFVAILERELDAKNRQIESLQRDAESKNRYLEEAQIQAGEQSERILMLSGIISKLQNNLLALTERTGEPPAAPIAEGKVLNRPVYFIALAVVVSLIVGLALYLLLA